MKSPEALRQKANQRRAEIVAERLRTEAAKVRAKNKRQKEFVNRYGQEWRDWCEQAVADAVDNGRTSANVRFEPGAPAEGREERKEFTGALTLEIADELRKQGFRTSSQAYHLPGGEIYHITLTIDWSKPL